MKELIHLIVKEIFGDDFADLCLLIYIHGKIDLKTIISQTKQTFSYIKDLLLILIKHNFVEFTIPNPDNLPEPIANAEYKLSESTILNSLRYFLI